MVCRGWMVDQCDGVVGEQRVGAAGELQVVADVAGGFLAGHAGHVAAHGDALFERGQGAELHLRGEGGLAEKYCGEGGFGVEVVVGEQPQRFQRVVVEQVALIDTQDRGTCRVRRVRRPARRGPAGPARRCGSWVSRRGR